jgi:hypothetical protein
MVSKLRKERLIIVYPERDDKTGLWSVKVVLRRVFELPDLFESLPAAKAYGLQWAMSWIDAPPD